MAKDEDGEDEVAGRDIVLAMERLGRLMRAAEQTQGLNPAQWEALRFIARANRFSNSPGALTRYLGATKGTISQTVIALTAKGFIAKAVREGEKRSVALTLTAQGQAVLAHDPWARLATAVDEALGGKTRRRLGRGLRTLLDEELRRGGHGRFGPCLSCRYFRERGRGADGPAQSCMKFEVPLAAAETGQLCVEHVPRG